jgi:enoyl-CoA hydratase/carnithine racemase
VAIELTARSGSTFNLHLGNPDRLNATTLEDWLTLRTLLAEAAAEPALRALLITTEGRHFCAGADLELHRSIRVEVGWRLIHGRVRCAQSPGRLSSSGGLD